MSTAVHRGDHAGSERAHAHGDLGVGGHLESYEHVHGGPPVLDIGGDIGAMVVTMPDHSAGHELHLRSADAPSTRLHAGVWRRDLGAGTVTAAVFLELAEGRYWILDGAGQDATAVTIVGGRLTEVDLTR